VKNLKKIDFKKNRALKDQKLKKGLLREIWPRLKENKSPEYQQLQRNQLQTKSTMRMILEEN
jgi:hypothetical protein